MYSLENAWNIIYTTNTNSQTITIISYSSFFFFTHCFKQYLMTVLISLKYFDMNVKRLYFWCPIKGRLTQMIKKQNLPLAIGFRDAANSWRSHESRNIQTSPKIKEEPTERRMSVISSESKLYWEEKKSKCQLALSDISYIFNHNTRLQHFTAKILSNTYKVRSPVHLPTLDCFQVNVSLTPKH